MFTHIQAYNKHIQATEGSVQPWHIQNNCIFRSLVYSELLSIQNSGIFRTLAYSESEAYSEPCQTFTMKRFAKLVNGYISFHDLYTKNTRK